MSAHLQLGFDYLPQLVSWDMWAAGGLNLLTETVLSAHLDDLMTSIFLFVFIFFILAGAWVNFLYAVQSCGLPFPF